MFGDIWTELARLKSEDLQREGCRQRELRAARVAATAGRVGCLPAERRA